MQTIKTFPISDKVKTAVKSERGLQAKIAKQLNVSRARLAGWLKEGEANQVPAEHFQKFCNAINAKPSNVVPKKFLTGLRRTMLMFELT